MDLDEQKAIAKVHRQLHAQNAVHGMFADVLVEVGGKDYIKAWAEKNPGRFITLIAKMSPGLVPTHGFQGDVNITINNSLGRTELDGEWEEVPDG